MRWAASSGCIGRAYGERIAQQALPGQSHCFSATFNGGNPGGGSPSTNREAMVLRDPLARLAGPMCELEGLTGTNLPRGAHSELGAWVVVWGKRRGIRVAVCGGGEGRDGEMSKGVGGLG